jgi:hypothetical protein
MIDMARMPGLITGVGKTQSFLFGVTAQNNKLSLHDLLGRVNQMYKYKHGDAPFFDIVRNLVCEAIGKENANLFLFYAYGNFGTRLQKMGNKNGNAADARYLALMATVILKYLFVTHLWGVYPYEKELGEDVRPYALYPKVPLLLLLGNETPGAYTYIPPFHFEDITAAELNLLEAKRSDEVAFLIAERCNKVSRAAAQMPAVDTWLEHHARTAKLYPSGTSCEYSVEMEDGNSVARFADHRDFSTYTGQCELAGNLKPWASHSACSMHSIYKDRSFERFEQRGCVAQPWLVENPEGRSIRTLARLCW